jgi:hypothetical protein
LIVDDPRARAWRRKGSRIGSGLNGTRSARIKTIEAAIESQLEPGEQIEATLPHASTGMSPWLIVLGGVLTMIGSERMKECGIVVTDRRVHLVRLRSKLRWTASLEATRARTSVHVASYRRGLFFGKVVLEWPDAANGAKGTLPLRVRRNARRCAEAVAAVLR